MAIEIRELVVKATVVRELHQANTDFVTKSDLKRFKKDILEDAADKFRSMLDDIRERR
jgi:hypothetical protein